MVSDAISLGAFGEHTESKLYPELPAKELWNVLTVPVAELQPSYRQRAWVINQSLVEIWKLYVT